MDKTKEKPKAYDRVKNANNNGDVFIKTPYWTPEIEDSFEAWVSGRSQDNFEDLLDAFLGSDVAVSFKTLNGSVCATLAHQPSREANLPYLLTGWSDNASDALYVAMFKLEEQLKGIWEAPPPPRPMRRR